MLRHPLHYETQTRITDIIFDTDVQPNAVDLKVEKIYILNQEVFVLSEGIKQHRGIKEHPTRIFNNESDWWCLQPGYYQVLFKNKVNIGSSEAGLVISRSTLIRNGVYLLSGLYDSGYEGEMVGGLHVTTSPFFLKKGTRLGQYLVLESNSLKNYDGDYGVKGIKARKKNEEYEDKLRQIEAGTWIDKRRSENKVIKTPKGDGGVATRFKTKEEYAREKLEKEKNNEELEENDINKTMDVKEKIQSELDEIKDMF